MASTSELCCRLSVLGRDDRQKIRLPIGRPVFRKLSRAGAKAAFNFLSVFKFEERKNWRSLLRAFALEFGGADAASVALYILTSAYHTSDDLVHKVAQEVGMYMFEREGERNRERERGIGFDDRMQARSAGGTNESSPLQIYVITDHVPYAMLPALYKKMDAFVLPSRGEGRQQVLSLECLSFLLLFFPCWMMRRWRAEHHNECLAAGWGRPHMEAMAMGLPVIATNWSGPTAFLSQDNGYPIRVESLVTVKVKKPTTFVCVCL